MCCHINSTALINNFYRKLGTLLIIDDDAV